MQGKVKLPMVHITLVQDLKSIGELARDLPLGSFYDEKERKAVVPVPALGPSVSLTRLLRLGVVVAMHFKLKPAGCQREHWQFNLKLRVNLSLNLAGVPGSGVHRQRRRCEAV